MRAMKMPKNQPEPIDQDRARVREVVREYIKRKRMKQVDFAGLCGLGVERISSITGERPNFLMSLAIVEGLARGMNTSIEWLLHGDTTYPPPAPDMQGRVLSEAEEKILETAKLVSMTDADPSKLKTAMVRMLGLSEFDPARPKSQKAPIRVEDAPFYGDKKDGGSKSRIG